MAYGKIKADTLVYDNSGSDVEVTLASIGAKAPLASPTFTGTVTIPTPSAGDDSTKAASTAFVVNGFAAKASPTFTGTPAAPTAAANTNTTQIATTAFVMTELGDYATLAAPALTGTATGVNLTLSGNLTVNGTTTTVASTNTTISDNLLELNSGASSNANDSGIIIERGSTGDNAIIAWDESADKFTVGTTAGTASSTGDISITTGTLVANVEGNVTGTATTATNVTVADESSDTSCNVLFTTAATGDLPPKSGTNLTFNSSTGDLTATIVTDGKGNVRSIPSNAQSGAYVGVAADAGKVIYISTGGVTINNSVFSAGDAVTIINNSGSDQTITQGSGVTLHNSADAATGNRTLAARGMATIWFAAADTAYISGAGLS